MKDLKSRMATGAAWLILFRVIERSIGVVSTLILARLLIPADFGLVALATSIYGALEIMSSFSFDLVLIQNQQAERRHYDTAWTFNVIFGVANGVILVALASPAAAFFLEPRLEAIIYFVALAAFLDGLSNIGTVAFQKDLELHKEVTFSLARKLTGFVVTLILAFWLRSYWALVAGILSSTIVKVILSYWLHPYRPKLCLTASRELFHFSRWLLLNGILIFLNYRGIDFVIGKMAGPQAVGLYSVAHEISNLPTTDLVWPIARAVFPGYSKLAGDRPALRATFLQVVSLIALITIPAGIGIGLVAEPLVLVMLGEKWGDAVALLQVLAIYGVVRALHNPPGSIYLALGKPRVIFNLQVLHLAIGVPLLIWLMGACGLIGAPLAILAALAVTMPTNYVWLMRELDLPFSGVAEALWRPLTATALMCVTGIWLQWVWPSSGGLAQSFMRLMVLVIAGATVYVTAILAFWWAARCPDGAESRLLALVKTRFGKTGPH